jgi:LemA protein
MTSWIILAAGMVIALYLIATYNGLITKRNRVRNGWSQIDVQLKRRHDLIPNLVEAVKGYMQHERQLLESVVNARAAAINAGDNLSDRAPAENALSRGIRTIFAVSEAYPELKAGQNMLALQEELASTENRIAFARQFYNDAVLQYNTARETLPASLIAGAMGFREAPLFALDDPSQAAVPQMRF